MNPDVADAIRLLREKGVLNEEQAAPLLRAARGEVVSVELELRTLLYAGVVLLTTGVGLFLKANHDRLGPAAIASVIGLAAAACLVYAWRRLPPFTWGSAGQARPCVNRGGNRRINHAIYMAALTQLRNPGPGREYYQRKIAAGHKPKAALRCLKRRISDAIYRQLLADAHALQRGPGGHLGATTKISAANPTPTVDSSIKPQPGPQPNATPVAVFFVFSLRICSNPFSTSGD